MAKAKDWIWSGAVLALVTMVVVFGIALYRPRLDPAIHRVLTTSEPSHLPAGSLDPYPCALDNRACTIGQTDARKVAMERLSRMMETK